MRLQGLCNCFWSQPFPAWSKAAEPGERGGENELAAWFNQVLKLAKEPARRRQATDQIDCGDYCVRSAFTEIPKVCGVAYFELDWRSLEMFRQDDCFFGELRS